MEYCLVLNDTMKYILTLILIASIITIKLK